MQLDNESPYTYNANFIAKPARATPKPHKITLLGTSHAGSFGTEVEDLLRAKNVEPQQYEWGQELPADQDIISFVDLGDKPLLKDVTEEDLTTLLTVIDLHQQSTLLWLSHSAQMYPLDPHAAQILGMARTIRSELAMSFATLELETLGAGAAGAVVGTIEKIQDAKGDDLELDPDLEYAFINGYLNVGRFHWTSVQKSLSETSGIPKSKGLEIGNPGLLQTLEWTEQPIGPPSHGEVNIKMSAVGLNFKDIMHAMGIVNGAETLAKGTSPFGLEGAGYITSVGPNVTNVGVGDRVMMIGCESIGMTTMAQKPAELCVKIPEQLSDEEAATMPVVYVTVLMFLVEKWRLRKGQSILIHSAAGGKLCIILCSADRLTLL